jgi:hypothetical protein
MQSIETLLTRQNTGTHNGCSEFQDRRSIRSVIGLGIDHQFDPAIGADAAGDSWRMSGTVAGHRHREQLVLWQSQPDQVVEYRQCLRRGQLMVSRRGRIELRVIPVGFDPDDLFGKVLTDRRNDVLHHGQLGCLNLVSPRDKHSVRRKLDPNHIAIHPCLTARNPDVRKTPHQTVVGSNRGTTGERGRNRVATETGQLPLSLIAPGLALIHPVLIGQVLFRQLLIRQLLIWRLRVSIKLLDLHLGGSQLLQRRPFCQFRLLNSTGRIGELRFKRLAVLVGELQFLFERGNFRVEQLIVRIVGA